MMYLVQSANCQFVNFVYLEKGLVRVKATQLSAHLIWRSVQIEKVSLEINIQGIVVQRLQFINSSYLVCAILADKLLNFVKVIKVG